MTLHAAEVRIYIDADVLGLGKILAGLRNDVTYPGDPGAVIHKRQRAPCPITSPDVLDTDWIPQVAARDQMGSARSIHDPMAPHRSANRGTRPVHLAYLAHRDDPDRARLACAPQSTTRWQRRR